MDSGFPAYDRNYLYYACLKSKLLNSYLMHLSIPFIGSKSRIVNLRTTISVFLGMNNGFQPAQIYRISYFFQSNKWGKVYEIPGWL